MAKKQIPSEVLMNLKQQLSNLSPRSHERRLLIQETAQLYGVSEDTLYRNLREYFLPKAVRRSDSGEPRVFAKKEMEHYCEIIAAMKVRTSNKKGRHLSTCESIRLLERYGVETPDGFVQTQKSILKRSTVNRYLKQWGYDRISLMRQPAAVRFQATNSNDCWQFDMSPSDLKYVENPLWQDKEKGKPLLMLYSVVDDRSGVAYQEYRSAYGEDAGGALRFLFNAMASKKEENFPFQGIPKMIYLDNGPVYKSNIFKRVMRSLGIEFEPHLPKEKDGRRVTARSKGKVERPFRSVKEIHETLYHFHKPDNEVEANQWLLNFLMRYNTWKHRTENHSRLEDWLQNLPPTGIRSMCSWDRFCAFAREPERRKVGIDSRVSVDNVFYEVDAELLGETVIVWLGIFDHELYVEHEDKRYGPYSPVSGPIPLHQYRAFKKTKSQKRADRIEFLAEKLELPKAALTDKIQILFESELSEDKLIPFEDPDPFRELVYPNIIEAKKGISDFLGMPLAELRPEELMAIDAIVTETLKKNRSVPENSGILQNLKRETLCSVI